MVAERCLSASLPETAREPPQAMDAVIESMATNEVFVPTHIASVPPSDEAIGPVMFQLTNTTLLAGQVLMSLGSYIVKSIRLQCGKRARAIRGPDGAFYMVWPGHFTMATTTTTPQQSPRPQRPLLPMADDTAAASQIYLAMEQDTPSPSRNLLPQLLPHREAQATVETSELPPFQKRRQLFNRPATTSTEEQQFEEDTNKAKLLSTQQGERPDETTKLIQILLERMEFLENKNNCPNGGFTTPMQVHNIATPTQDVTIATNNAELNKAQITDNMQSLGDS